MSAHRVLPDRGDQLAARDDAAARLPPARTAAGRAHLDTDHVALVAALRQANPEQRRLVVLHHLVGLTVEEISQETGAPTGTIKARLARGRAAMARHLNEDNGEFGPCPEEVKDHA